MPGTWENGVVTTGNCETILTSKVRQQKAMQKQTVNKKGHIFPKSNGCENTQAHPSYLGALMSFLFPPFHPWEFTFFCSLLNISVHTVKS